MKSIAEDLNVSEDKATEIYNAVLANIPGLKRFMDESQEMARQLGYVQDKWGRRRYIPDMQLEPFEVTCVGTKNFDPFFDSEQLGIIDDTERLRRKYLQDISQAKYKQQKDKIKINAEKDGFKIKDNTRKIEDAIRQCVNARVQGSAATQSKIAMKLIGSNEDLKRLKFKMELLVHDEIIGQCPFVNVVEAEPIFQQCMLNSAKDLRTGAQCDTSIVTRWYGDEIELEDVNMDTLQKLKRQLYSED